MRYNTLMKICSLILQIAIPSPCMNSFDYLLPEKLSKNTLEPGIRILVPFGHQKKIGILLAQKKSSSIKKEKLKPIIAILDHHAPYTPHTFKLCHWAARYYHAPLGEVLFSALPKLLRDRKTIETTQNLSLLSKEGLSQLKLMNPRTKTFKLLTLLQQHSDGLLNTFIQKKFSERTIKYAIKKGFIILKNCPNIATSILPISKNFIKNPPNFELSVEQQAIVSQIKQHQAFIVFLLVGITGSGKTEIYFQVIQSILARHQTILFLVPEIGLTPQTIERFQSRFNLPIIVLHSSITPLAKLRAFQQAKRGDAAIVVGTRSAIFTPIPKLGLIIVDEEHDSSFKQQFGFSYSARDLSVIRGQIENIPVILGSATPSLESLYNVYSNRYKRLDLRKRVGNASLPELKLINLCGKRLVSGFSSSALQAIQDHLDRKQQVMIFLNRRGFAPKLVCRDCSFMPVCENCEIPFVLHQQFKRLCCHHCGRTQPIITRCPECDSSELWDIGHGTEKLEIRLKKLFPSASIVRIDRDNTRSKGSFHKMLEQINKGAVDIIIGTQMLAKGHHFPMLTLTIIVDADHGLYSQDFRALEKLGQTLIQVSGRTGRTQHPGEVYIQTYYPTHALLQTLLKKGYDAFAKDLLQKRQVTGLPPFSALALLKARSKTTKGAIDFLNVAAQKLQAQQIEQLKITGPFPAAMEKKANYYHAQLWIQSKKRQVCQKGLQNLMSVISNIKTSGKVQWSLDVDPISVF